MSERSFASFEVLRFLGMNCLGETYLVRRKGLAGFSKKFILRKLQRELSNSQDFLKIFSREVRFRTLLLHPNIVELCDINKTGEEYYCLLEYVEGFNLAELFQEHRPIEPKFMIGVVMQLLQALHFAHNLKDEQGQSFSLLHRDIRPDGIFLSVHGLVKLADFGMGELRNELEKIQTGKLKGQFNYLSPEQVDGAELTPASDIFTIGTILYEGLSGHSLFQEDGMLKTLRSISKAQIPPLKKFVPDIDPVLEDIIYKALKKNPEERFQTALEFFDILKNYISPISLESLRSWIKKNVNLWRQRKQDKNAAKELEYSLFSGKYKEENHHQHSRSATACFERFVVDERIALTKEKSLELLEKLVNCNFPKLPLEDEKIVLQGSLKELNLIDLIQLLSMTAKTAKLLISRGEHLASISFENGNLIDALVDDHQGIEAVEKILEWEQGEFVVKATHGDLQHTINQKTEYLILDILRRKDERENKPQQLA